MNSILHEKSLLVLGSLSGHYFGALANGCWSLLRSFLILACSPALSPTDFEVLSPTAVFSCLHLPNTLVFPYWEESVGRIC